MAFNYNEENSFGQDSIRKSSRLIECNIIQEKKLRVSCPTSWIAKSVLLRPPYLREQKPCANLSELMGVVLLHV